MKKMLPRFFCLAITTHMMAACTVLQPPGEITEQSPIRNQRIHSAEEALSQLQEIDTLVKLENSWLANQIETGLVRQSVDSGRFSFRKLKLQFDRQLISLDSTVDMSDDNGNIIAASVSGEILLEFNGSGLEWLPLFSQIQITSKDFVFEDGSYAEPIPELNEYALQTLRSEISEALIENGMNTIPMNVVPLGEVQVGASLPGFAQSPARHTQALRGVFMVNGNAMMVESSSTTVALDLSFIPDLSTCPADVTVSRAEFAAGIEQREPVGIARNMDNADDIRFFYSEIAGAKRPLTIIHYWFADGLPVAVKELAVGPSERWRTWSAKGSEQTDTRHWEVLVVEKESGCILYSESIRSLEPESDVAEMDQAQNRPTFESFQEAFNTRIADFSISIDTPVIALAEVRRPFLRDVLQDAMSDLRIDAEFDGTKLNALRFTSRLQTFDAEGIICEHRKCQAAPACKANLTDCKRLRDTRDCSSCLFRNPLNNRCVSEAVDPMCEAARSRQNAKYDADRAACISDIEASKSECDQLNAQALRSCQIEAGFEGSVCESIKTSMQSLKVGAPLAHVSAESDAAGLLTASFSNFSIEGDLEGLKLNITLNSDLKLDGDLNFSPASIARPLADCITAWSGPFSSRFVATPEVSNLLTNLVQSDDALTATWSGFGVAVETNPSPLEYVFVGNPQLLANCRIGLTVNDVEQAFTGDGAEFFRGQIDLAIQPLPTRIHLAPATIEFGDRIFSAEARLSTGHLRFDFEE